VEAESLNRMKAHRLTKLGPKGQGQVLLRDQSKILECVKLLEIAKTVPSGSKVSIESECATVLLGSRDVEGYKPWVAGSFMIRTCVAIR